MLRGGGRGEGSSSRRRILRSTCPQRGVFASFGQGYDEKLGGKHGSLERRALTQNSMSHKRFACLKRTRIRLARVEPFAVEDSRACILGALLYMGLDMAGYQSRTRISSSISLCSGSFCGCRSCAAVSDEAASFSPAKRQFVMGSYVVPRRFPD